MKKTNLPYTSGDRKKINSKYYLPFDPAPVLPKWPHINNIEALVRLFSKSKFSRFFWIYFSPATLKRFLICFMFLVALFQLSPLTKNCVANEIYKDTVQTLAGFEDRSSGTTGSKKAAIYIKNTFQSLGFENFGVHQYALPVRVNHKNALYINGNLENIILNPMILNAISPETTGASGIEGPLIYVKKGTLKELNDKRIKGAIVLMDLDSGTNWLNVAGLSAKAVIYIDKGRSGHFLFSEKYELSPLKFPRFWISLEDTLTLFDRLETYASQSQVKIVSDVRWKKKTNENIYCLIEGSHPKLKEELIWVEAFYDSARYVINRSPGADEALSIASLLSLAAYLKEKPPHRSVLLVATSGHAQSLSGFRELIWSVAERSKSIRNERRFLKKAIASSKNHYAAIKDLSIEKLSFENNHLSPEEENDGVHLQEALMDDIKNKVEEISSQLTKLRFEDNVKHKEKIKALADLRLIYRKLSWKPSFRNLSQKEKELLMALLPKAKARYQAILSDLKDQMSLLKSATHFRSLVKMKETSAIFSLHLSSHGNGLGAFHQGFLFPLKPMINRTAAYSLIDQHIRAVTTDIESFLDLKGYYKDTLRPSKKQTWESFFLDQPALGGEVSAIAGFLGITLATVNDARKYWGTPHDTVDTIDWHSAIDQNRFVLELIHRLSKIEELKTDEMPRKGFATVSGRANFIRQGELFPDQPAKESIILSFQGPGIYHNQVDTLGRFQLRGIADKKHLLHKVIIEGYQFQPETGDIIWAVDKPKTGKSAYRVKMNRLNMKTDLIMFGCTQTTLFNLLEPRTFRHMTKIRLIDGRTDAPPSRYWYSRIDTRKSVISSIFLEPGTQLKLTLSDSVLENKMILTNGDEKFPYGKGYSVEKWPFIAPTEYQTAKDMWTLLTPRLNNLESRGIYNERLRNLEKEGVASLKSAERAMKEKQYDAFFEFSRKSWALAIKVYKDVNQTQKDILLGVLFYVALFIPFSFCMERLIFSYQNIYKRIIAFGIILMILIGIIYAVHPAFRLAYNPMVVIWAFFISGLSLMVILIIFLKFEEEMLLLRRHTKEMRAEEISTFKAFSASFFLGVSNLRRRRLRTALTSITLIILTFTVMNFTSVKTVRRHFKILYQAKTAYHGLLLKEMGWKSLPPDASGIIKNALDKGGTFSERGWLETEKNVHQKRIPIAINGQQITARGLMGISHTEPQVSGIHKTLTHGRWFNENERDGVIISDHMAKLLKISDLSTSIAPFTMWGMPFQVIGIFSSKKLFGFKDLDGEPITPVTFPGEIQQGTTDIEMEAMESGEDIKSFQSRYEHVPAELMVIIPFKTMTALGGHFKSVAIRSNSNTEVDAATRKIVDRFGLTIFSGEKDGTYMYSASNRINYGGVPNILIPLAIAISIVLNTMINSVYERKGEIAIYTSVGLAPSHVSFLFIAEALSFAVISVVIGYIIAQSSAKLLSNTALWEGMTVNYSSLSAVSAMAIIIIVVLLSSIYPSKVAAKIAIPDVKKTWTIPKSENKVLSLTLPFLMKQSEVKSAGSFLFNYFKAHEDISHGYFSTGSVRTLWRESTPDLITRKDSCFELKGQVWLAPFDFGIMQDVTLSMCTSMEEEGFLEINLSIHRKSGEMRVWQRVNKEFVYQLRKQLLTWRSLPESEKNQIEERIF